MTSGASLPAPSRNGIVRRDCGLSVRVRLRAWQRRLGTAEAGWTVCQVFSAVGLQALNYQALSSDARGLLTTQTHICQFT